MQEVCALPAETGPCRAFEPRFAFNAVAAMMVVQMLLGIMTVLYLAPLSLALLHQVGAVALFALILRARFLSHYPTSQSVRG